MKGNLDAVSGVLAKYNYHLPFYVSEVGWNSASVNEES